MITGSDGENMGSKSKENDLPRMCGHPKLRETNHDPTSVPFFGDQNTNLGFN